jgi:hypothetical protein
MAIGSTSAFVAHSVTGSTASVSFDFQMEDPAHLIVQTVVGATITTLARNVHYTVSGGQLPSGGVVTFTPALTIAGRVLLRRATPLTQPVRLRDPDRLAVAAIERGLDRLQLQIQELDERGKGALRVSLGETVAELPRIAGARDGYLKFVAGSPQIVPPESASAEIVRDVVAAALQVNQYLEFTYDFFAEKLILNVVGVAAAGHGHALATPSADGFMAAADKAKLNGLPAQAAPAAHTHDAATTLAAGFMSAADKTKLDGMPFGGLDPALSNANPAALAAVAAAGTAIQASRADHVHPLPTARAIGAPTVVSNIAALRALNLAGASAPLIAVTQFSHVDGDGAGLWLRDAADTTSADNAGAIIVDAAGQRWKRQHDGYYHARWFNARADGATNATSALQAAGNAATAVGLPLLLDPGVYVIGSGSLTFTTPIELRGRRERTELRRTAQVNQQMIEVNGAAAAGAVIEGIDLTSTAGADPANDGNNCAVRFKDAPRGQLRDVRVIGRFYVGINFEGPGASGGVAVNCSARGVRNRGFYAYLGARDILFDNCEADGFVVAGATRYTDYGFNSNAGGEQGGGEITYRNCRAINCGFQGFSTGDRNYIDRFQNCFASNIRNGSQTGVGFLVQNANGFDNQDADIIGCTADLCDYGAQIWDSQYVQVNGLRVRNSTIDGIDIKSVSDCTFSGLVVRSSGRDNIVLRDSYSSQVSAVRSLLASRDGIRVANGNELEISDWKSRNNGRDGLRAEIVSPGTACQRITIANGRAVSNVGWGVNVATGAYGFIIEGNHAVFNTGGNFNILGTGHVYDAARNSVA